MWRNHTILLLFVALPNRRLSPATKDEAAAKGVTAAKEKGKNYNRYGNKELWSDEASPCSCYLEAGG